MKYSEWKHWFLSLPWAFRWFVLLVLVRPLVDSFYFLKNTSVFLSPLYIVGVLTPAIILVNIMMLPKPKRSSFDQLFGVFSLSIFFGTVLVMLYDPFSFSSPEFLLKSTTPIYLYYYLRRFIKSEKDLNGLLQTFLYSISFVVVILLYELIINPIKIEQSRGVSRIQGSFGDVVSYGIYFVLGFLIVTYFFFKQKGKLTLNTRAFRVFSLGTISIIGLFNIHHVATYVIFFTIVLMFFLYNFKTNHEMALLVMTGLLILFFLAGYDYVGEKIEPLIKADLEVMDGELDTDRLAHGRMGRWERMWGEFTDQNVLAQLFGYPITFKRAYHLAGSGAHNDYIRILFLSGFFGLALYLKLLQSYYKRAICLSFEVKYFAIGILVVLALYSISVTPTFFAPFMYIAMASFAYIGIPRKIRKTI